MVYLWGRVKRENGGGWGRWHQRAGVGQSSERCRTLTIGQSWVPVMRQAEANYNEKLASHRQDDLGAKTAEWGERFVGEL